MKKILAAVAMAMMMAVAACGGDKSCDDAAKNVAKLMDRKDDAGKLAEECKKEKFSQESINCAANAKDMEALGKCPRK